MTLKVNEISVCVPAYNEEGMIKFCLESIIAQEGVSIVEILVGTNSSTDQTSKIVEGFIEKDSRIRIVESPKGKANAWNALNRVAKCSIRFFQDGDCVATPDSYRRLLSTLSGYDIAGASIARNTKGAGVVVKILNFPYYYVNPQGRLNGGLYVMDYERVSVCIRELIGTTDMPNDVINDDAFLQLVCKKASINTDVFVEIKPSGGVSDEIRRYRRMYQGSHFLIKRFGFDGVSESRWRRCNWSLEEQFRKSSWTEKLLFFFVMPIKFVLFRYIHYMARRGGIQSGVAWK